ncbi:MAG: response regulator transcription factor [Synechococcaceae cyanobacterium]|nr:response regulator transcription factor [Synechococcaceae cyanobacterium]
MQCFLVDDHRMVAQAIGGLLCEVCNLEAITVCGSVAEALPRMEQSPPDLLLLDVHLPGESWQDAAEEMQRLNPSGRLIIITGMSDQFLVPAHLQPMLLAVVDKGRAWSDLVTVVNAWKQELPRDRQQQKEMALLPFEHLSPRELRVFDALGKGLLNKEIARELGLTISTVETYRKSMSAKLGISGAELVRASVLYRCCQSGFRLMDAGED